MRHLFIILVIATSTLSANAEEQTRSIYRFTVTEYTITGEFDATAKAGALAAQIMKADDEKRITRREQLQVTALDDQPGMAQFGRQASVPVAFAVGRDGRRVAQTRSHETGTLIEVVARQAADKKQTVAEIKFEVSRLQPPADEDQQPTIRQVTINSTLVLTEDEPTLLGHRFDNDHTVILVTVDVESFKDVVPPGE